MGPTPIPPVVVSRALLSLGFGFVLAIDGAPVHIKFMGGITPPAAAGGPIEYLMAVGSGGVAGRVYPSCSVHQAVGVP